MDGRRAYVEGAQLRAELRLESSPRDLIRDYLLNGRARNSAESSRGRRCPVGR